jgi:hypothetical protein
VSRVLGPVLATGAATIANRSLFQGQPVDWRVPIATGLAGIGFTLVEKVAPQLAQVLAWTTFATVMLTRTDPNIPSPVESAASWWKKGSTR